MQIPKELGSYDDIKRREQDAFKRMSNWHDLLDDVYEYFLPNRNLFDDFAKGQKKMDRIFDSTAMEAIQQAASKLQENIAPIQARWATFAPSNEILNELATGDFDVTEKDIRENLENQATIVFDYINRSNFATQFFEHALDLLVGTGTLRIDEADDNDMPIVFTAIPQKGIAFEEGPYGTVETHWRRFKMKARDIPRKYRGYQPTQKMQSIMESKPDTECDIREGVIFDPKKEQYYGLVWSDKDDRISWMEDYGKSSPYVVEGQQYKHYLMCALSTK